MPRRGAYLAPQNACQANRGADHPEHVSLSRAHMTRGPRKLEPKHGVLGVERIGTSMASMTTETGCCMAGPI